MMQRLLFLPAFCLTFLFSNPGLLADDASLQDPEGKWHGEKPNVLWILIEDWSTDLSCYGTPLVRTPNIDNLADGTNHAEIKSELLAQINRWREEVNDIGVTEEFRNGGWPAKYPTKSLGEWQSILGQWEQAIVVEGKASRGGRKKNRKKKIGTPQSAAMTVR